MGWRRRIEQAYRFEAALEIVIPSDGPVLDVGAGLGELAGYAKQRGVAREWVAVEPRASFAQAIRDGGHYERVIEAPFHDVDPRHVGCAVAIGVLTASPTASLDELASFLRQVPASMFTVLDRGALDRRVALAVEHHASAVTHAELAAVCQDGRTQRISTTDFAVFWPADFVPCTIQARFEATVGGPWGSEPPAAIAWLACELGLDDEARQWLSREQTRSPLATIVRERLRLR